MVSAKPCLFSFVCSILLLLSMQCTVKALRFAKRSVWAPSTACHVNFFGQQRMFCSQSIPGTEIKKQKTKSTHQETSNQPAQGIDEIKKARVTKLEQLKELGTNPFAYSFDQTHKAADLHILCKDLPDGQEDTSLKVSICGRIMVRRVFGKLAFFQLQDDTGLIQLYLEKGHLPGDSFDHLKNLTDAGDIIGVKGTMKRTDKVQAILISDFVTWAAVKN